MRKTKGKTAVRIDIIWFLTLPATLGLFFKSLPIEKDASEFLSGPWTGPFYPYVRLFLKKMCSQVSASHFLNYSYTSETDFTDNGKATISALSC